MKRVKLIIAGAGGRGTGYASFASLFPDRLEIVGVAEPRDFYRSRVAETHGIPPENVFTDWKDMAARDRFADAVVVATQDALHADPAVAFAEKGYHMLLEKPMAPNEADCRRIVEAVIASKIIFAVGHVMRYTSYTKQLKQIVDSGAIGEVVSLAVNRKRGVVLAIIAGMGVLISYLVSLYRVLPFGLYWGFSSDLFHIVFDLVALALGVFMAVKRLR